jgi:hypothetical protein
VNKRKKVAWQKHRVKAKKLRIKRKQGAAAGGAAPGATTRQAPSPTA